MKKLLSLPTLLTLSLTATTLAPLARAQQAPEVQGGAEFDCEAESQILTNSDISACGLKKKVATPTFCDPRNLSDNGQVWRVGSNRWNEDWEGVYEKWLRDEADPDIFVRYKIATDCADAALAYRIVFSRIHHLPFRMQPEIYRKTSVLGHDSTKFAKYQTVKKWTPENWKLSMRLDDRFRYFLEAAMGTFGPDDIAYNTYPIKIASDDRCSFHPRFGTGVVVNEGGHVQTVFGIDPNTMNPLTLRSSTVPIQIRSLVDVADRGPLYSIQNQSEEQRQKDANGRATIERLVRTGLGYVRWSWDVQCEGKWGKVRDVKMPDYSLEQYTFPFKTLSSFVRDISPVAPDEKYFSTQLATLEKLARDRVKLVEESEKIRVEATHDAELMAQLGDSGSALFNAYSTPHRDVKICNTLNDLMVSVNDATSTLKPEEIFRRMYAAELTQLELPPGRTIFGKSTHRLSLLDLISFCSTPRARMSNPDSTVHHRWQMDFVISAWTEHFDIGLPWKVDAADQKEDAEFRYVDSRKLLGRDIGPLIEVEAYETSDDTKGERERVRRTWSLSTGKLVQVGVRDQFVKLMNPDNGNTIRRSEVSLNWIEFGETLHYAADGATVAVRENFDGQGLKHRITYHPDGVTPRYEEKYRTACESSESRCIILTTYAESGQKLFVETKYENYVGMLVRENETSYSAVTGLIIKDVVYERRLHTRGETLYETRYYDSQGMLTTTVAPQHYSGTGDDTELQTFFKNGRPYESRTTVTGLGVTEIKRFDEKGSTFLTLDLREKRAAFSLNYDGGEPITAYYHAEDLDAAFEGLKNLTGHRLEKLVRDSEVVTPDVFAKAREQAMQVVTQRYLRTHPLRQSMKIGHCELVYDQATKSFTFDGLTAKANQAAELFQSLKSKVETDQCYFSTSDGVAYRLTSPQDAGWVTPEKMQSIWQNFKSRLGFAIP